MTNVAAIWHGTNDEMTKLQAAIERECGCVRGVEHCLHRLLTHQKALDRLLFVRRISQRLLIEESMQPVAVTGVSESTQDHHVQ